MSRAAALLGVAMAALSEKGYRWLAVFAASYVKRLLDTHAYDQLFDTEFGRTLRALPEFQKHLAEFMLHGSNVFIEEQLKAGTPFEKFFKEVLSDIPSEAASRILDSARRPASEPDLIGTVSELSTADAEELVGWLAASTAEEREQVRDEVLHRSSKELAALVALKPETRTRLLALAKPDPTGNKVGEQPKSTLGFLETFAAAADATAERLRQERKRG